MAANREGGWDLGVFKHWPHSYWGLKLVNNEFKNLMIDKNLA